MRVIAVLTMLLLAAPPGHAADSPSDEELLARAEAAFQEGVEAREQPEQARAAFGRSATAYEELHVRGASNPALYHNLGNAHFLAGDLPHAVLAYRRGLSLAPNDATLRQRLEAAREAVYAASGPAARPPAVNWPPWLPWVSPAYRLWLAAFAWALACVAGVRWWMTRQGRWTLLGMVAGVSLVLLAVSLVADERRREEEQAHPLVVVARDGVALRKGNGEQYPPRPKASPLSGGVEARLLLARGDWLQVELAGGEVGWVRRDQVLLDVP